MKTETQAETSSMRIAIRDDLCVFVEGLPRDITKQEIEHICHLIRENVGHEVA